jgi:flagellar hook-associated protein 3 FlgL
MTRVKTLTVRGADNSLGSNEKKAIAQELREIQEHILRISNSNDGSRYFFSGTNTAEPAFERVLGIIQYNGNQNEITYQLDDFV